jgi:hypothetical protein
MLCGWDQGILLHIPSPIHSIFMDQSFGHLVYGWWYKETRGLGCLVDGRHVDFPPVQSMCGEKGNVDDTVGSGEDREGEETLGSDGMTDGRELLS